MIIDTHCHYNLPPLLDDWRVHWQAAQEAGVKASIVVGTSGETSGKAVNIAATDQNLYAAVGIHPGECGRSIPLDLGTQQLDETLNHIKNLATHSNCIALGECGLDYFRLSQDREMTVSVQKKVLEGHLVLAQELDLPLIIHLRDTTVDAYHDFLTIYKSTISKKLPFILHCVSGPIDFVSECVKLGAYIGVAGNVTYPSSGHIRDLVKSVPSERLLAETDAPFLPPQVARGKTCLPQMIQWTVEYISTEFGYNPNILLDNTVSIFPQFRSAYEAYRNS